MSEVELLIVPPTHTHSPRPRPSGEGSGRESIPGGRVCGR